MILVQESPLSGQILTLLRPVGKEISLRMGEILEGQVVDIFPSGGLTIKVKGGYLPIRSELNFEKKEILFLKVLGPGKKNGEVVLQLINTKTQSGGKELWTNKGSDTGMESMDDSSWNVSTPISKLMSSLIEFSKETNGQSREIGKLRQLLGELLKSLPADIQALPKGLKIQMQQVLQASIQRSSPEMRETILQIIKELSEEFQYSLSTNSIKDILIPIEELDSENLKNSLDNSGVLLEARIRAMVKNGPQGEIAIPAGNYKINNNLKAILLQLQEAIQVESKEDSSGAFLQRILEQGTKSGETEVPLSPKGFGGIDNLLKDIETFQLLSKISDSFHTFLPIQWDELKRGELTLKRRQQSKGSSFSCSIHLDLERLGPISVFLFMQSENFYVNFKTDHPELKTKILSHLEVLQEGFNREGLNLKSVSIHEKGDTPSDPLEPMESEETIINIRI